MKIIIASTNEHKLREFKKLLNEHEIFLASDFLTDFDPSEGEESFSENAKIKAKTLWDNLSKAQRASYTVIADDSGLCVEALDGLPGVLSARFGDDLKLTNKDERNRQKLKTALQDLGLDFSRAYFICVICLIKNGEISYATGICNGTICTKQAGENGFGYDSMFVPEGFNQTFAQLSEAKKNEISHRFLAVKELKKSLI